MEDHLNESIETVCQCDSPYSSDDEEYELRQNMPIREIETISRFALRIVVDKASQKARAYAGAFDSKHRLNIGVIVLLTSTQLRDF